MDGRLIGSSLTPTTCARLQGSRFFIAMAVGPRHSFIPERHPAVDQRGMAETISLALHPAHEGCRGLEVGHCLWRTAAGFEQYRTLLHANFTAFTTNEDRTGVHSLTVRSLNGVSAKINAAKFVLCCGGIENARLLLLAAEANSGGFGNNNDLVGRFFMQHPRGPAGLIVSSEQCREPKSSSIFSRSRRPRGGGRIDLDSSAATEGALLNCSGVLRYQGDPESGLAVAQDIGARCSAASGHLKWARRWDVSPATSAPLFGTGASHCSGTLDGPRGFEGVPSRSAFFGSTWSKLPTQKAAYRLRRIATPWVCGGFRRIGDGRAGASDCGTIRQLRGC